MTLRISGRAPRPASKTPFLSPALVEFLRRRATEIVGLAILAVGLALLLTLVSYAPTDPSPNLATKGPVRNLLGLPGAYTADVLLRMLGLAGAGLAALISTWGWRIVTHRGVESMFKRSLLVPLGILLLAAACAGLATPEIWPLPKEGLGGFCGKLLLDKLTLLPVLFGFPTSRAVVAGICFFLAVPVLVQAMGLSFQEWRLLGGMLRTGGRSAIAGSRRSVAAIRAGYGRWSALRAARAAQAEKKPAVVRAERRPAGPRAEPRPVGRPERREPSLREISGGKALAGEASRDERPRGDLPNGPVAEDDDDEPMLREILSPALDDEDDLPVRSTPAIIERPPSGGMARSAEPDPRPKRMIGKSKPIAVPANEDGYDLPPLNLLALPVDIGKANVVDDATLNAKARQLESVLSDFGVRGDIVKVRPGPVVTLYELEPAPGTKASRVIGLADDIARYMSAVSVRVAVVPGRNVIGIELPNEKRETVYLRELLSHPAYSASNGGLPLVLGKDIGGGPVVVSLERMPHLLIAGTTGSGKSVAINTMILSLLYRLTPEQCRFIMIDPKMLELSVYDDIPHLLSPVVTDPRKAVVALKWVVREMENRYRSMSTLGVRNIAGYNARLAEARDKGEILTRRVQTGFDPDTGKPVFEEQTLDMQPLPFIVVVVDEMADLMLVAGKDIEAAIQRLAQMARAAGIHLIAATQRPSVDVITGTIKANFPTRVSFQVTSKIDSRTILGEGGAEQLLGQGDMLYMAGGGRISRVHGPFVSDAEVEEVVRCLKNQAAPVYIDGITEDDEGGSGGGMASFGDAGGDEAGSDDLYQQAVALVAREKKASTSFIQRHLQIGYNRAARIIERMEQDGIVSASNHVGKREVLLGGGE